MESVYLYNNSFQPEAVQPLDWGENDAKEVFISVH